MRMACSNSAGRQKVAKEEYLTYKSNGGNSGKMVYKALCNNSFLSPTKLSDDPRMS